MDIKQVVIWGHKLHTHTHSYIHNAFYKTYTHLGYKTIWLNNNDNINNIDFSNTLFLTEGQVDNGIPIRKDSYYILHNCNMDKYNIIPKSNILIIQVFSNDVIKRNEQKIDEYIYYNQSKNNESYSILYMPWATDLLPEEINNNILNLYNIKIKREINFVGYETPEWNIVKNFCNVNKIAYNSRGGFQNNVDALTNQQLIKQSFIAPSIQTKWQVDNGYIPCRIFKNISYGRMGVTNSYTVFQLFKKSIVYNPNINICLKMAINFENNTNEYKKNIIIPLMCDVRENHTYINRTQTIFDCFKKQMTIE